VVKGLSGVYYKLSSTNEQNKVTSCQSIVLKDMKEQKQLDKILSKIFKSEDLSTQLHASVN
jgi:hypothetical protein